MAKTNAIRALRQRAHTGASREAMLLALASGAAAMPWQAVTRCGD